MPPVEDLENPNYKFATEIFSEDGKVLGTYSYSKENRVFVGYNDLSPHIINALIATEDVRFAGEAWYSDAEECRRRQYNQPAAFQTTLFAKRRQHSGTSVPKAHRVGYSREAGTLLYQRGNSYDVSQ